MKKIMNFIVCAIMALTMVCGAAANAQAEVVDNNIEVNTMSDLVRELKKENHFMVVTYKGSNELSVTYSWGIESKAWFDEWITTYPKEVEEFKALAEGYGMTLDDVIEYYTNWHLKTSESYRVFDTLVMT